MKELHISYVNEMVDLQMNGASQDEINSCTIKYANIAKMPYEMVNGEVILLDIAESDLNGVPTLIHEDEVFIASEFVSEQFIKVFDDIAYNEALKIPTGTIFFDELNGLKGKPINTGSAKVKPKSIQTWKKSNQNHPAYRKGK